MTAVKIKFEIELLGYPASSVIAVVDSDGELSFPDPIMEYEIAYAAMSGARHPSGWLLDRWQEDPIATLLSCQSSVPLRLQQEFLIDVAESVIPILEKHSGAKAGESGRQTVELCRRALAAKRTERYALAYRAMSDSMHDLLRNYIVPFSSECVVDALYAACEMVGQNRLTYITSSRKAVAESKAYDRGKGNHAWDAAYGTQELWEIKRFVELMAKYVPGSVVPQ